MPKTKEEKLALIAYLHALKSDKKLQSQISHIFSTKKRKCKSFFVQL